MIGRYEKLAAAMGVPRYRMELVLRRQIDEVTGRPDAFFAGMDRKDVQKLFDSVFTKWGKTIPTSEEDWKSAMIHIIDFCQRHRQEIENNIPQNVWDAYFGKRISNASRSY